MALQNVAENFFNDDVVQEALDNFASLLDSADFASEFAIMGIGRMQFMRRRQMLTELRGLYMALWRLALASSFPHDADAMFDRFLETYRTNHPDKVSARTIERARGYWGMLQVKGDSDFSDIARHLCSFSENEQQAIRPLALRLALHIRQTYKLIFDRLI